MSISKKKSTLIRLVFYFHHRYFVSYIVCTYSYPLLFTVTVYNSSEYSISIEERKEKDTDSISVVYYMYVCTYSSPIYTKREVVS